MQRAKWKEKTIFLGEIFFFWIRLRWPRCHHVIIWLTPLALCHHVIFWLTPLPPKVIFCHNLANSPRPPKWWRHLWTIPYTECSFRFELKIEKILKIFRFWCPKLANIWTFSFLVQFTSFFQQTRGFEGWSFRFWTQILTFPQNFENFMPSIGKYMNFLICCPI